MSNLERSRSVINQEHASKDNPPKVNWAQHATALENFSTQYKFLTSNFLFSLSTQKPRPESNDKKMLSTRPIACNIKKNGTLQSLQVEKAWKALFNIQLKNQNYLRPGTTAPIKNSRGNANVTEGLGSCNTSKESLSFQRAGLPAYKNISTYQGGRNLFNDSEAGNCGSLKYTDSSLRGSISISKVNMGSTVLRENIKRTSMPSSYSSPESCEASHTGGDRCADGNYVDAMDDEILENIDVDQIVMSHYQAVGTPQGSASNNMPSSPNCSESNVADFSGHTLPQELCEQCKHGFKLAHCPNASNHLQEIKDRLITISNELLDNAGDLSPKQFEVLRQERLLLNKQIQQLEKHLQDIGRQKSQTMTSTTPAQSFLINTPLSRVPDGVRFDSQGHVRNEFGNYGNWNSPVPFSTTDGPNFSFAPMEREVFTPKLLQVTYIEGSGDKRWKSVDFSWSKKLEVYNRKVFGNHSFRPNQREVINATMSGYDVFVLMPTGGGKSLTYQLPALICPGLTLVVSPLVSLIQDQIMHLLQANISAAYLSGNMEWAEQQEILRELQSDTCKYKLLYVTPEKVAK